MSVLAPGILRSFLDFWEICVPRITTIIILTCGLRYSGMSRSADCNLPTFRDSLSVPSSKSIRPRRLTHEYGTDRPSRNVGSCPETLVTYTNQRCVTSQKNEDLIYTAAEAWNLAITQQHYHCLWITIPFLYKILCGATDAYQLPLCALLPCYHCSQAHSFAPLLSCD